MNHENLRRANNLERSDFPLDPTAAADLCNGLPFIDLHMAEAKEFAIMVEELYGSDRDGIPKGVTEVVL